MSTVDWIATKVPVWLWKLIYPIPEESRTRDREMKVLCLGLGRTGTDSLRNAFHDLGYRGVCHGFYLVEEAVNTTPQWERLSRAKWSDTERDPAFLNTAEFDKVLGHCEVVTDLLAAAFGVELLRAYPNAKVILNRRPDLEAWYQSQLKTIDKIYADWPSWSRQWFDIETFWIVRMVYWTRLISHFNFAKYGKVMYEEHYAELERELKAQGREWLDWKVQDGWEPICELLGEAVPEKEFPNENATASGAFDKRRANVHKERIERAFRRMRWTGAVLGAAVVGGVGWFSLG